MRTADRIIGGTALFIMLAGGACLDTPDPDAFRYICAVILLCGSLLAWYVYKYNLVMPECGDDEEYEEDDNV